jgi:hypothetical protein
MRKKTIGLTVLCATACLVPAVQAQSSSDSDSSSINATLGADRPGHHYTPPPGPSGSPTGGAVENQGTTANPVNKILGAPVVNNSGQNLGTLNNMIVNYNAGKVDFGVLSLNQSASGQLVPVPWSTLHASSTQPLTFTFTGDPAKLQGAPSFSQNSWPDVNQSSWRQSIYSYYGVAYGGGESPAGILVGSVNYPGTTTTYKPANDMQQQRPTGPSAEYYQYYYPYYQYSSQP